MKIHQNTNRIVEKPPTEKASPSGVRENNLARSGSSSNVEISEDAKLMRGAHELVRGGIDNRSKVEELKRQIDSGTYRVDAAKVADRLVDEHLSTHFGKNSL